MHYFRKSPIFFILFLFMEFSSGTDTLQTGQTLKDKDGDFLTSVSKSFTLGFFSPAMSANRYLGIYYSVGEEKKIVWVANRNKPVNDRSGVVFFNPPNHLVLHGRSEEKQPLWSTFYLGGGTKFSAKLLDTGNLIVFDDNKKRSIIWQSFDHPTDTWLPNMKFGYNWEIGRHLSLISWNSVVDPGSGNYSFKMEIGNFTELSLCNGLNRIWRTGPLDRHRSVEELSPLYNFSGTYFNNTDEIYMTYSMRNPSAFSYISLSPFGLMEMSEWNPDMLNWTVVWTFPKKECDNYNFCGPNNYCSSLTTSVTDRCSCFPGFEKNNTEKSRGCVRKRGSNACGNGDVFVKFPSMKIPDTRMSTRVIEGSEDCEKECLRNCDCTAYVHATEMGFACVMWYGDLLDARKYDSGGKDLFVRVAAIKSAPRSSNKKFKVAAVAISSCVVAVSIAIFIKCWHNTHKRKGGSSGEEQGSANQTFYDPVQETDIGGHIPLFDLSSLVDATNNFSNENKLGQGGFGSVYKGTLKDGQLIAVKRLSKESKQGLAEFRNEATLIRGLQHRNLVHLLGCCVEQEEKILIYEFMPNKSLNSLIFDKEEGSCLDWRQRFEIIMGITRGMVYLHHDSRQKIIHRDLKLSNILLDAQLNPKISDFGTGRFFEDDQAQAITKRIVGTYGYMAPEYAMEGICSMKSDVYSFGVLLLEIVNGRKTTSFYKEKSFTLVGHAWELWCQGRALELIDSSLPGDYSTSNVLRCIHVGLLSVQLDPATRPTMVEINEMLVSETTLPPPGKPPLICTEFERTPASSDEITSSSTGGAYSVNSLTLSAGVTR